VFKRLRQRRALAASAAAALTCLEAAVFGQQTPPPQFRTSVTVVPVAVRVTDAQGDPVRNLRASDFELLENGVHQEIAQFSTTAHAESIDTPPRTFVFLLGFGTHEASGAIKALTDFVRTGLLPRDRVSVVAYLRASTPSSDHDAVAQFLERYRGKYRTVEGKLRRDRGRLRGPMLPLSSDTMAAIDEIFESPGSLRFHDLPGGAGGKGLAYRDLTLFAQALEFVRLFEGDKHLVWLMERRTLLGKNGAANLARAAAGARTTVTIITTGGSESAQAMSKGRLRRDSSGIWDNSLDMQKTIDDRSLAELSGGVAAFYRDVRQTLARVARITEFEYVLGYEPAVPPIEGEYRDIRVAVRRRGMTPMFQHGVQPRPGPEGAIDVRAILAESRIREATESAFEHTSIPVTLAITSMTAGDGRVSVTLEIDPKNVMLTLAEGKHQAALDVVVYVADVNEHLLAQQRQRIEIAADVSDAERIKKQKIQRSVTLTFSGAAAQIKAVVYDYDSDRLGTKSIRVR
jgi:VWFA-related protein